MSINGLMNPHQVKKSKELDDNQSKSDRKDPEVVVRFVLEGRYSEPYIPEVINAELRVP